MTTATDVAAYIVARENVWMDNLRLQKLVYFCQAWSLGWTGKPLIADTFEAWANGPVDRELWKTQRYGILPNYHGQLTDEQIKLVETVVDFYKGKSSLDLRDASHEAAWQEARGGAVDGASGRNSVDQDTMRRYYASLAIVGEGPARLPDGESAASELVGRTAGRVIDRWKEGLEILANR